MKLLKYVMLAFLLILSLESNYGSVQEDIATISIKSIPMEAEVQIDGNYVGTTPLNLEIASGEHSLHIMLAGFQTYQERGVYYDSHNVTVELSGDPEFFIKLPGMLSQGRWNGTTDKIRFGPVNNNTYLYNIETNTVTVSEAPFNWLDDENTRLDLGLPDVNQLDVDKSASIAYQSPSGRYLVYQGENNAITLHDTLNQQSIGTQVIPPPSYDTRLPAFEIFWSQNENFLWVAKFASNSCDDFIIIKNDQADTLRCPVTTSSNEDVVLNSILAPPSDSGKILALSEDKQLWVVDLADLEAKVIPIDNVFDATFDIDDPQVILVAHASGISHVSMDNLNQIEPISDIISSEWGVYDVDLSFTGNYAIVSASNNGVLETFWLFIVPEHTTPD